MERQFEWCRQRPASAACRLRSGLYAFIMYLYVLACSLCRPHTATAAVGSNAWLPWAKLCVSQA